MKMSVVVILSCSLAGLGLWQYVQAAPNQIYLSPSSVSVQNGNNFTVSLRATPGSPSDGVEATITYDQAKLQFVSIDSSSSAFNAQLAQSGGSGSVNIIRGSLSGTVSADSMVAQITFKALAGSGTTPLTISAGNMTSSGSYTSPSLVGATISLTTPVVVTPPVTPVTPPTQPTPSQNTPKPSTTTPAPSTGTPTPNNTGTADAPPAPSAQKEVDLKQAQKHIEFNTGYFNVTAAKNVSVYFVFGIDAGQLQSATTPTAFGTNHDIKLDGQLVSPGLTYYYKVIVKDEAGAVSESEVQSFKTKGYTVKMAIKDADGNPLKARKLALHSDPQAGETDASGEITFENVAPGDHHLEYEQGGKVYSETVTVASEPIQEAADGTQTAAAQDLAVVFAELKLSKGGMAKFLPIVLILVVVAGAAGIFFFIRKRNQLAFAPSNQPAFNPFPAKQDPTAARTEELVNRVKGVDRPDPGSVVNPKPKQ